jgi:tripartite-type tricarboxylate transporter receptor subunit TctC
VLGFLNEGRLRALAVGAKERIAQLPDVPTLAEAGLPTDLLMPTFFALAAPAGTPAAAIRRINAELKRAVALPDVVAKLAAGGLLPVGDTPEELSARVARDFADFGTLVRSFGIKVE